MLLLGAGCNPSNLCAHHTAALSNPDGGATRCVRSEDCPRPGATHVCVTSYPPESDCVQCVETRCQSITVQVCR